MFTFVEIKPFIIWLKNNTMTAKKYFSKFILVTTFLLFGFGSFSQRIVMDSVSFVSPQIVCNPDTLSFFFKTGLDTAQDPDIPFSNTDIHVDLPNGYKLINIIYTMR